MNRLLQFVAVMLGLHIGPSGAETPALQVLVKIGPWSALIAYRGRI